MLTATFREFKPDEIMTVYRICNLLAAQKLFISAAQQAFKTPLRITENDRTTYLVSYNGKTGTVHHVNALRDGNNAYLNPESLTMTTLAQTIVALNLPFDMQLVNTRLQKVPFEAHRDLQFLHLTAPNGPSFVVDPNLVLLKEV